MTIAEGTAIDDLMKPDRVLIGGEQTEAGQAAIQVCMLGIRQSTSQSMRNLADTITNAGSSSARGHRQASRVVSMIIYRPSGSQACSFSVWDRRDRPTVLLLGVIPIELHTRHRSTPAVTAFWLCLCTLHLRPKAMRFESVLNSPCIGTVLCGN